MQPLSTVRNPIRPTDSATEPKPASKENPKTVAPFSATHPDIPVEIDGQDYLCIPNVDQMPPFLMSVVSDSDFWLFVGSNARDGISLPDCLKSGAEVARKTGEFVAKL